MISFLRLGKFEIFFMGQSNRRKDGLLYLLGCECVFVSAYVLAGGRCEGNDSLCEENSREV